MNVPLGCSHFTAVRLTFLVISIYIGGGFSLVSNTKCGGNLTIRAGSTGEIKSPRFPLNYPDDVKCEWKIYVEEGSKIKLTFTDFEVECYYDFLEIYNGGTKDSGNQVTKLCGSSLPDPIEFIGNELLLRFHPDSSINFKGFKLQFTTTVKCGGNLTARAGSTGEIKSPHFPFNYADDVECEWKIHVESGSGIKLTFTDFEVECYYDSLEIYNGGTKDSSNQVTKLCGSSLPDPIEFSGNELLLRFHSDSSINFKGFKLQFATTGECGGNLTTSTGEIKSPRSPLNYPDDVECEWKIRVGEGSRIKLTFTEFEVESSPECEYGSLEVYNGGRRDTSKRVAKLCGSALPDTIASSGNELFLRFHSNSIVNSFKLQFTSTVKCGGNLTTSSGEIKSPRFPLSYPNDVECEWKIYVEEGSRIKLTFIHFEVESGNECRFDSLEIYNGGTNESSNRVAKLCGTNLPAPIESGGKELLLRFHSDSSLNIKGFKLQFATTVPAQVPAGFSVNATSSTSIRASWQLPPADFENGIVRGYKLLYKKKGSAGSPTMLVISSGSTFTKTVTGLEKYTEYEFQVLAFTSVGDGPKSSVKVERTKEDGQTFRLGCSSYIFHEASDTVSYSWVESKTLCENDCSKLVSMENLQAELNFLRNKTTQALKSPSEYYIGLRKDNGKWKWISNNSTMEAPKQKGKYPWAVGQPGGDGNCAKMYFQKKTKQFVYDDTNCNRRASRVGFICERQLVVCNNTNVDGGWSAWSKWTECSVTCATGVMSRERRCDNPAPTAGGRICEGNSGEVKSCNASTICIDRIGCSGRFSSTLTLLRSFKDEIDWTFAVQSFKKQMEKMVEKCARLAKTKGLSFFAVENYGNCYGAQDYSPSTELGTKKPRCNFGVGLENYFYVYKI